MDPCNAPKQLVDDASHNGIFPNGSSLQVNARSTTRFQTVSVTHEGGSAGRLSHDDVVVWAASMLEGSGASVHLSDSPLQRISRDLLTLRGHMVFDWDRTAELAGKLELGLEPAPTDLL